MKKKVFTWRFFMGVFLVGLSAALYWLHYFVFNDAHHIFIYFLGDLAFVPLEVLVVTLILHRVLTEREKKSMLEKLNMLIGTFFSDAGTSLLKIFSGFNADRSRIQEKLKINSDWSGKDFSRIRGYFKGFKYNIDSRRGDLFKLKELLDEKRGFLLTLLANPNVLEHESFTKLLWAVFHLAEELDNREDVSCLPEADLDHLSGDIHRAYGLLVYEWLSYMEHLKNAYPYLFSLAVRTNPFDPEASPVLEEA